MRRSTRLDPQPFNDRRKGEQNDSSATDRALTENNNHMLEEHSSLISTSPLSRGKVCQNKSKVVFVFLSLLLLPIVSLFAASRPSRHPATMLTPFDIYCEGPILDLVQLHYAEDNKDFVDRPMRMEPDQVMEHFQALPSSPSRDQIETFVNTCFDMPGSDLEKEQPVDFVDNPPTLLARVNHNASLLEWALELNGLWKELGRRPRLTHPNRHSYLPTKNLLVVAGGRFREIYYWDSYWIVLGLLACDMVDTAKGVAENLLDYVDSYGFVPNGGRIYYLTRSQPPMLSEMVRVILAARPDAALLARAVPTLEKEYAFWMKQGPDGHAVKIQNRHVLNRYVSASSRPRPESYREDMITGKNATSGNVYREMITMAETGWDFSSRWLRDQQNLDTSIASEIIPVDLNSILHRFESNMMHFYTELGNADGLKRFTNAFHQRQEAIEALLWSDAASMWKDYNLDTKTPSSTVSISNFFPLWSNSLKDATKVPAIVHALESSGLIQPGGVFTTTTVTEQQWDEPNAWPPLQDLLIDGLLETQNEGARKLARQLRQRWIETCFVGWKSNGFMYEKYDATEIGKAGGGGEYGIQLGFGWTNGVVLKMLTTSDGV